MTVLLQQNLVSLAGSTHIQHYLVLRDGGRDPPHILATLFFRGVWFSVASGGNGATYISTESFTKTINGCLRIPGSNGNVLPLRCFLLHITLTRVSIPYRCSVALVLYRYLCCAVLYRYGHGKAVTPGQQQKQQQNRARIARYRIVINAHPKF